jgi:hypothetical protein
MFTVRRAGAGYRPGPGREVHRRCHQHHCRASWFAAASYQFARRSGLFFPVLFQLTFGQESSHERAFEDE